MKYFVLILICAAINSLDDTNESYRKYYGLSFHKNCGNYFITFKCLTACKSMGFQIFRLDYKCKCTCHELKTTTILPAFVWRTNGTTREVPATFSPKLYDVVGTMSPASPETEPVTTAAATVVTCESFHNKTDTSNDTNILTSTSASASESESTTTTVDTGTTGTGTEKETES